MESNSFLSVYGITFAWSTKAALSELSLELRRGETLALLGPNGSGKSTLMKLIAGLISLRRPRCTGQIKYLGQNLLEISPSEIAKRIAYVGPDLRVEFPLTVEETVQLGRTCHQTGFLHHPSSTDLSAVRDAMEACGCLNLKDRDIRTLSGGERQLVALAKALAQGAKILLLDEAISKMDVHHQAKVGGLIRELNRKGISIMITSHDLYLATLWADRVVWLQEGLKIFDGAVHEAIQEELLQRIYPGASLGVEKSSFSSVPRLVFRSL